MKVGFSFGITSGIITTLGLMIGLYSSTHSKLVVIGGILTIAIADAVSDALGIHISEESENAHTQKQIWISTFSTLITKFFFAIIFIIPVLLFTLQTAIIISIIWGLSLLIILSYNIANKKPLKVITEHLIIIITVIILTYFVGKYSSSIFA